MVVEESTVQPPKPKARWGRRLRIAALCFVGFVLVLRVLVPFVLPHVLQRVAKQQGVVVRYDRLALSVMGGSLELWNVVVEPLGDPIGDPAGVPPAADAQDLGSHASLEPNAGALSRLEFLTLDIDVSALFMGTLRARRVEVDGWDVYLSRPSLEAGWQWEGLPAFAKDSDTVRSEPETAPREADAKEAEATGPFEGFLGFEVLALRFQHVQLHVRDGAASPPLALDLECNVRLSDLGNPEATARLEVFAHANHGLDALELDARLRSKGPEWEASGSLRLGGLRAGDFASYLAPLGLEPRARQVDANAEFAVRTQATSPEQTELDVQVALQKVALWADGVEQVAIDSLVWRLPSWTRSTIRGETLEVRGVRARASRDEDGILVAAGFAFPPRAASKNEGAIEEATTRSPSSKRVLEWPGIVVQEGALQWNDAAMEAPVSMAWWLDEASVGPFRFGGDGQAPPIELQLHSRSPGLFASLDVQGTVDPNPVAQSVTLSLEGKGLTLAAAQPYLEPLGLRADWKGAELGLQFEGARSNPEQGVQLLDGVLSKLELRDGELLGSLGKVEFRGLRLDANTGAIQLHEVLLDGADARVERDREGLWRVLGLAIVPKPAAKERAAASRDPVVEETSVAVAPPKAEPAPAAPDPMPEIRMGNLRLRNYSLTVRDEWLEPSIAQTFQGVHASIDDLWIGGEPGGAVRPKARWELGWVAAGLADSIEIEGTITSPPGPLHVLLDAQLLGTGLRLEALQPWLPEWGLESTWKAASLKGQLRAGVQAVATGTRLSLECHAVEFEDQGVTWLRLDALRVPEILLKSDGIALPTVQLVGPLVRIERNAANQWELLGLRLVGSVPESPVLGASPAGALEETRDPAPVTVPASDPFRIELGRFETNGGTVEWSDASVTPAVHTELVVHMTVADVLWPEKDSSPATFHLEATLAETLDRLRLDASVRFLPNDLGMRGELALDGLRAGPMAAYFPKGLSMELKDGSLRAQWEADWRAVEAGGSAGRLLATDWVLREGKGGAPLLTVGRIAVDAPRIDWSGGRVELGEVALTGVRLPVEQSAEGVWSLLGMRFDPGAPQPEPAPVASAVQLLEGEPALELGGGTRRLPTIRRDAPPLVTLAKLDVGVEALALRGAGGSEAIVAGLRLQTGGPLTLLAPDPEALPPIEFQLEGSALPLMERIAAEVRLWPYAAEPGFDLRFGVTGIHGDRLADLWPLLSETLDASTWTSGEVRGHLETHWQLRRRSPLDFPLQDGFGLRGLVDGFSILGYPEATQRLGFDELHFDVASVLPATGQVHVRQVEWTGPFADIWRDAAGWHIADLVLKPGEPEVAGESGAVAASEPTADPPAETPLLTAPIAPEGGSVVEVAPTAAQTGEVLVDELLISGGHLSVEDRTVDPVFRMPIQDLDFEAKRFSTRTLVEDRPFRYRLALYGGKVELPERDASGNLVSGLLGSVSALASGKDSFDMETRPVFDEFVVRGSLSLGTKPKGWTQVRVRGLELPVFRGLAKAGGVDIGDGLLDQSALVHFDGQGAVRLASTSNFSYLSLSEPPNGPISSYLKLPAPLDTVLFVLKDENGDQSIPLHVVLPESGSSLRPILGAVTTALGTLIGQAIASSPMRVVGGVLDLAGLGSNPIELTGDEWVRVPYAPFEIRTEPELKQRIAELVDLLQRDASLYLVVEQGLGSLDVDQAAVLANPDPASCLELAHAYRRKRGELLLQRDTTASEARSEFALGQVESAQAKLERLRELDGELLHLENALDRVLERSVDQGERSQQRRTRDAALELVKSRQAWLGTQLKQLKVPSMGTRLDLRRPRFQVEAGAEQGFVHLAVQRRR